MKHNDKFVNHYNSAKFTKCNNWKHISKFTKHNPEKKMLITNKKKKSPTDNREMIHRIHEINKPYWAACETWETYVSEQILLLGNVMNVRKHCFFPDTNVASQTCFSQVSSREIREQVFVTKLSTGGTDSLFTWGARRRNILKHSQNFQSSLRSHATPVTVSSWS